jgi:prepilin-type N-terminal cleavage/methylation domain-containing protein/prepilin-type processing-associated H-X9-DG protein
MRKAKAFTLIELLVVIAIIALLMAILIPTFQRVSREAKAIGCRSKLKQWGILFSEYLADHDGGFFPLDCGHHVPGYGTSPIDWSIYQLVMTYFPHPPNLMLCPMTPVPKDQGEIDNAYWNGGTYKPYRFESPSHWDERRDTTVTMSSTFGSYGLNQCARVPPPAVRPDHNPVCPYTIRPGRDPSTCTYHWARRWCWRNWLPERTDRVPVLLDCTGPMFAMTEAYGPPPYEDIARGVLINRHNGYVNGLFMDFSVRKIGLKELWTLKWNPHFDTANHWTKAGRVRPEDWPPWMWKFKDY